MSEQLRAQRRFTIWTAVLVTLAVALAATGAIASSTQIETDRLTYSQTFDPAGEIASVTWWTNGPASHDPIDEDPYLGTAGQPGQLETMVDEARDAGMDAVATLMVPATVHLPEDGSGFPLGDGITGVYPSLGMVDDSAIIAGREPRSGEIVLAGDKARMLGVSIGDPVDLSVDTFGLGPAGPHPVTVVGLSRPTASGPFASWSPSGYVAWEDALDLQATSPIAEFAAEEPGETTHEVRADVGWETGAPGFEALESAATSDGTTASEPPWELGLSGWALAMVAAAGLVTLATLGATIAMARSQAQARVEWVATARVLGARRSTIVAASMLEAVVVGAVASAAGIVIAYAAVAGLLAAERVAAPGVVLPSVPAAPAWALLGIVALGLTLTAIASAVPAFWAARTSPVAALRNVRPLADAQVSRTVSGHWLIAINVVALTATGAALWAHVFDLPGVGTALAAAAWVTFLVLVVADVVELCRRAVPRAVARLARSPRPWAVVLGARHDSRRRQWAAAASIVALTVGGIVAGLGTSVLDTSAYVIAPSGAVDEDILRWSVDTSVPTALAAMGIVGAISLAVIVAGAVIAAARAAGTPEDSVHAALGLSARDARVASACEVAVPLASGAVVGAIIGWVCVVLAHAIMATDPLRSLVGVATGAGLTLGSALLVLALAALPVSAAAALAASVPVRTRTPAELSRDG